MLKVNVVRIIEKMAGRGYNKTTFSRALGMDRSTLDRYLNHPEKMTVTCINAIIGLLCDSSDEAAEIVKRE